MSAADLRQKFLEFFSAKGGPTTGGKHAIVPSSSLLPDDPSVLLTTAGMQQFKKYYTGEADPIKDFGSKNTVSVQKSFRTSDIDEVGDDSHLTFFEMLGNFSFGGYFKKEAIQYAYDFLTNELGLSIGYVSVFRGGKGVAADEESEKIWKSIDSSLEVRKFGRIDNFWGPTGSEGPCGPTTEIYINGVEIWNLVFNEYYAHSNGKLERVKIPGVDTGMGLERLTMVVRNVKTIFDTNLFRPFLNALPEEVSEKNRRIIVDHLRSIAFLISDGVRPSNKESGYILRRLMRRLLVFEQKYKMRPHVFEAILHDIIHEYGDFYKELLEKNGAIRSEFSSERDKFSKTLSRGLKEMDKVDIIDAKYALGISTTHGLPYEIIREMGGEKARGLKKEDFDREFKKHQEISRAGVEKKFGGHGLLLDTGELKAKNEEELKKVTRLHTATHLLNAAMHKILGDSIEQRGSDITVERTRFDFLFPRKLTADEIKKIEELVNYVILKNFPVSSKEMLLEEAKKSGALFFSKGRYPDKVRVYTVGMGEKIFSRELCGGPHVSNTGTIGHFRIIKEEASSAGIRRIRAIIE